MKIPALLALLFAAPLCLADDAIPAAVWHSSAELGAITTSGNTNGTSVTGKLDARQDLDEWSNQFMLMGFFKEDEHQNADGSKSSSRSAERYGMSAKAGYKLLEDGKKLFVLATYVDDKFGAYVHYATVGVGHSTRVLNTEDKNVEVELGPGYFSGKRANGEAESGFTVRGAAALRWQVAPTAQITQTVSVERGTSNMRSSAEMALSTKINGTMQMKAAIVARNDSNVPVDKKNTDTQTSLTLVYSF